MKNSNIFVDAATALQRLTAINQKTPHIQLLPLKAGEWMKLGGSTWLTVMRGDIRIGGTLLHDTSPPTYISAPPWKPCYTVVAASPVIGGYERISRRSCEVLHLIGGPPYTVHTGLPLRVIVEDENINDTSKSTDVDASIFDDTMKLLSSFDEEEYPVVLRLTAHQTSAAMHPITSSIHLTTKQPLLLLPPQWGDAANQLLHDVLHNQSTPKIVLVNGDEGNGKSTFCVFLINVLLNYLKEVAYLETDVRQPLSTNAGIVSLTYFNQPILCSSHCLLCTTNPTDTYYTGALTPLEDPIIYLGCIYKCTANYLKSFADKKQFSPLMIVNTHVWRSEMGYVLNDCIASITQVTDVIEIGKSTKLGGGWNVVDDEGDECGYDGELLTVGATENDDELSFKLSALYRNIKKCRWTYIETNAKHMHLPDYNSIQKNILNDINFDKSHILKSDSLVLDAADYRHFNWLSYWNPIHQWSLNIPNTSIEQLLEEEINNKRICCNVLRVIFDVKYLQFGIKANTIPNNITINELSTILPGTVVSLCHDEVLESHILQTKMNENKYNEHIITDRVVPIQSWRYIGSAYCHSIHLNTKQLILFVPSKIHKNLNLVNTIVSGDNRLLYAPSNKLSAFKKSCATFGYKSMNEDRLSKIKCLNNGNPYSHNEVIALSGSGGSGARRAHTNRTNLLRKTNSSSKTAKEGRYGKMKN